MLQAIPADARLNDNEQNNLSNKITLDDLKYTIEKAPKNKSPGLDGLGLSNYMIY
jgi:hypothetical protein